ncbi:MAG: 7,8-didemethyl-8-hydroxy-5-deazariboflavin synthase subunit CofH [Halodesulfurarchaeum sp.]
MGDAFRTRAAIPRDRFDFDAVPETRQSFETALEKAKAGDRLTVEDGIALLRTGTDVDGIDSDRTEAVRRVADRRRADVVGDDVTFVANLNNNLTTACDTGCLFCNFRDSARTFETEYEGTTRGFTKTPEDSRQIVSDAVDRGISEVTAVSGLHPALVLDEEHRDLLDPEDPGHTYTPPSVYDTDPGTYVSQIEAMSVEDVHVHAITPEEAAHAARGTDWSFEGVYRRLADAGLDSVPGTAAEILVDEVREVICPAKIDTETWIEAMEGAAAAGLPMTATIMYGHVENERHRIEHLKRVRELQDRTGAITEFVPLSFVHEQTELAARGLVDGGSTTAEDELMIAVSRLFLDNVPHIQSSWVKYGDDLGLRMLEGGADDYMGTILSEEITKRAGGEYGEYRTVADYVEAITSIGRTPVERSTDYERRRRIDPDTDPLGPTLGPRADGTPLLDESGTGTSDTAAADD